MLPSSDRTLVVLARKLYQQRTGLAYDADYTAFNHRLRSSGGRFCVRRDGRVGIEIHPGIAKVGNGALEAVMLHELAHFHLYRQGLPHGHTAAFRALAQAWQFPRTLPAGWLPLPARHAYACPGCGLHFYFGRRLKQPSSCARCSEGRWNEAYRLRYLGRWAGEEAVP